MKKEAILIIGIILFSSLAAAGTLYVKTSVYPAFTLEFTEDVVLLSVNLTREGRNYPLTMSPQPPYLPNPANNKTYAIDYRAVSPNPLMNGEYLLKVVAMDIVDNYLYRNETVVINLSYMKIWISDPKYSVSPKRVFNLTVTTENPTLECRYAYIDVGYGMAVNNFTIPLGTLNGKSSFKRLNFNSDNFLTKSGAEKKLYVYCKDTDNRIHPRTINVSYDTTKPVITANADPEIIVEKTEDEKIVTNIKVVSDDKVVCDYSVPVHKPGVTTCTYVPSISFVHFANYNQTDLYGYVTNPATEVDVTALATNVTGCTFDYNVSCKNRAGNYSDIKKVPVKINLVAPVRITKISPPDASSNKSVFLNFTTSKLAECSYELGDKSGTLDTKDRRHHSKNLGDLEEGKYTVTVSCSAAEGSVENDFIFMIDLSPPTTPIVSAPSAICTKKISAKFSATDALSGVAGFNYSLESVTGIINAGYVSGSPATVDISSSNFTANQIYTFKAMARDKAGFWSAQGTGNSTLYDDTGKSCDKTPPLIYLKKNKTAEGYIVYLTCIDMQTSCNNVSYSSSLSDDKSCLGTSGPLSYNVQDKGYTRLVQSTTYFCYEASDIAGNKANGYEYIEISEASHCNNSISDSNETDVDCGGSTTCERCRAGGKCFINSDCVSDFCDEGGFCRDVSCDDKVKNGFESDVDCGGVVCKSCEGNQSCISNSDCSTGFCLDYVCTVASCSDLHENGDETDVDCGGSCPAKCENIKKCKVDSDCVSGYCSGVGEYKICAEKELGAGEEKNGAGNKTPVTKTALISVGLLSILSSIGYIAYLRFMPKAPLTMPSRAPPRPPARPPAQPPVTPPPARPPARKETEFERLEKIKGESRLERLGRGRGDEALERLGSKTDFEKLGRIRKGTKLERLGKGKEESGIEKLKPKKKPKNDIEELRK